MFLPEGGGSISCVTTGKITVLFLLIFAFYARDEKANDSELSGSKHSFSSVLSQIFCGSNFYLLLSLRHCGLHMWKGTAE
jgi:hypothetical protein